MAQPSVASYFATRKRAAVEDINIRSKVLVLDQDNAPMLIGKLGALPNTVLNKFCQRTEIIYSSGKSTKVTVDAGKEVNDEIELEAPIKRSRVITKLTFDNVKTVTPKANAPKKVTARRKHTVKGTPSVPENTIKESFKRVPKVVPFEKKGLLSPVKSVVPRKDASKLHTVFANKQNIQNESNNATPTKRAAGSAMDRIAASKEDMSIKEIKTKLSRSSRLAELKASMSRLNKGMAKMEELHQKSELLKPELKEFKSIELVIPASPQKVMSTPQKTFLSPHKVSDNTMMSPRKTNTTRKLLFSPAKNQVGPAPMPAYQRYQGLAEASTSTLVLPYNYRCLAEQFRCVDAVCAMLYNRKESITFSKLKPAVQEMLRKNFTESHLAQIKTVYPDGYTFSQEKTRNFGSSSKRDHYELIIVPNVVQNGYSGKIDADNVIKSASEKTMNPQVTLNRQRTFYNKLIDIIMVKHDAFLATLDPPMVIAKHKLARWHPEFDIEKMPDIEKADIPQPPNVEMFSSAKDVLSQARDLFNCNTRMEKALERLAEAKSKGKALQSLITKGFENNNTCKTENLEVKTELEAATEVESTPLLNPALKGIPKSLLDKVRAKQAAKAFEAMTRTPAKDKEAIKHGRLPELARHTRNLFVTEKKSVLPLELVLNKLGNSYRANLTPSELKEHLELLSTTVPGWIAFHDIRKTIFVKLSRDADMAKVLSKLEALAAAKAK